MKTLRSTVQAAPNLDAAAGAVALASCGLPRRFALSDMDDLGQARDFLRISEASRPQHANAANAEANRSVAPEKLKSLRDAKKSSY